MQENHNLLFLMISAFCHSLFPSVVFLNGKFPAEWKSNVKENIEMQHEEKNLSQIFRMVFILCLCFLIKIVPKTEWKKCELCSVSLKYNCINATYKVTAAHGKQGKEKKK